MKGLGIIAEYNPFHYGHAYHIQTSHESIQSDYTVAVMSGNWVQRGEPAIIDKWSRTEIALQEGIDLVIELPFIWATQSAKEFARGAVSILAKSGSVKYQTFGSETGDLNTLTEAALLSLQESDSFRHQLTNYLDQGLNYSQALAKALNLSNLASNDILGIEYLKAHHQMNSHIKCNTVQRIGGDYHDVNLTGKYSSATSIRKTVQSSGVNTEEIIDTVPDSSFKMLSNAYYKNQTVFFQDLEKYILYKFKITSLEQLTKLIEWETGLEQRIHKAALSSNSLSDFLDNIKTKRYTRTRLNRLILHNLFDITKKDLDYFNYIGPPYLRVLGMNDTGKQALKDISKSTELPILTRPAKQLRQLSETCRNCFQWEVTATSFYNLLSGKDGREEFTRPPVII